jgi:hypothetical protein
MHKLFFNLADKPQESMKSEKRSVKDSVKTRRPTQVFIVGLPTSDLGRIFIGSGKGAIPQTNLHR